MPQPERRAAIGAGLAAAKERIAAAAQAVGRDADEISLVVVTKTFPVDDIEVLLDLGVREVGENRDQEAAPKAAALANANLRWHFIGQLQTNKTRSVARYADVVESIDRPKLVTALGSAAATAGRTLDVLVQVNLGMSAGRGGAPPEEVLRIAELIKQQAHLRLRGVMAVAPLGADPDDAFERLRLVAQEVRADHPEAAVISAGMSGDLEAAIRHGATQVRLGSAILGYRPPVR